MAPRCTAKLRARHQTGAVHMEPAGSQVKKMAGSTVFYRFNCTNGLLSKPDRFSLWFSLLVIEPSVRSGSNNYGVK